MGLEERDKKILLNSFAKKLLFAWQWSRKEKGVSWIMSIFFVMFGAWFLGGPQIFQFLNKIKSCLESNLR